MTWVNPVFLWGLLGISVPILIHLWSGRRGKVLFWAATAWLNPQDSQSSRSIKLDHRLLLLIRILLWMAIVFLIVGIWWKGYSTTNQKVAIHAVFPDSELASEFRFELKQAVEKGEKVVWLGESLDEFQEGKIPSEDFNTQNLQKYLDALNAEGDSVHLYLKGSSQELPQSTYWLKSYPVIHLSENLKLEKTGAWIQLDSGKFLGMNSEGNLEISRQNPPSNPVLVSPISVSFQGLEEEKNQVVQASLDAIVEVYGLEFREDAPDKSDLMITSDLNNESIENQLVLNINSNDEFSIYDPIFFSWEEVVQKGMLPEMILQKILTHYGVDPETRKLSKAQITQKFQLIPETKLAKASNSSEIVLVVVLFLFGLERFLAYRSNQ